MITKFINMIIEPSHDRRIQACLVILFSMGMILLSAFGYVRSDMVSIIIDWSYSSILGVVGVYHFAHGFSEWNSGPAPPKVPDA